MTWFTVLTLFVVVFSAQAYDDSKCEVRGGTCQLTSQTCSGGEYVRGYCGGPSNHRCCIPKAYDDTKCEVRGGKCQMASQTCSGGGYFSGFCGGPSNRRCCIPKGPSGCMKKTEQLACELLESKNVVAFSKHPSGNKDNAYPSTNLRDVCTGRKASRSSYKCKAGCFAPGGSTCLSFNLLNYLVSLKNTRNSGIIIINELAGACHSCESRHYSGLAVDLHKNDHKDLYMRKCRDNEGWALEERNHVHCQFYDGVHPNWKKSG